MSLVIFSLESYVLVLLNQPLEFQDNISIPGLRGVEDFQQL